MEGYLIAGATIALTYFLYNSFAGGKKRSPRANYGFLQDGNYPDGTAPVRNWRLQGKSDLVQGMGDHATLYQNFEASRQSHPQKRCMGTRKLINMVKEKKMVKGVEKTWEYLHLSPFHWESYDQIGVRVENFGSGLLQLGLKTGQNMALYSETRAEWHIAALGAFSQNIVVLTVYANLGLDPIIHAFNEGEIEVLVTNAALVQGLLPVIKQAPGIKHIIYTDDLPENVKDKFKEANVSLYTFAEVEKLGKESPSKPSPAKSSDSLAVIMYTSGTTGMPKGVMLTHRNVLSTMGAAFQTLEIFNNEVYLSYLPLAHILAFVIDMALIGKGCTLGFGNPRSLSTSAVRNCKGDLEELSPTIFAGVPSVHDRIKQGIEGQLKSAGAVKKFLFQKAYNARKAALSEGRDTPLWNLLVFNKFKRAIGGQVRMFVSGGAPLSPACCEFLYVCFGAPVCQGYGLTETCGGSIVEEPDAIDLSGRSCGAPLGCCELRLVDVPEMNYTHNTTPPTGEIWIRGASVSVGYFKNPTKTKEEFTDDGWFKTGDIGRLHSDGTFSIVDRKKNLVKPPHGEYIAPERLESIFKNSPFVDNIMVYASSKFNEVIAFVAPNKKTLLDWAASLNLGDNVEAICKDPRASKAVLDSLGNVWKTANLRSIERIQYVRLFHEEWTPENGWLTAAMKLRRNEIHKQYAADIESIYVELSKRASD